MTSHGFTAYLQGIVMATAGCVHAAMLASSDLPAWFGLIPVGWIAGGAYMSWLGMDGVAE